MVNTFIVSDDYETTARLLDYKRLGKQRVEAMQIINVLEREERGEINKGWKNHPATKMWRGNVNQLKKYTNVMITEWIRRGYKNTMKFYSIDETDVESENETDVPWFVKWKPLQYSHMASLVRKDRDFYKPLFKGKYPIVYSLYTYLWTGNFHEDTIESIKNGELNENNIVLKELTDKIITTLTVSISYNK